MDTRERKTWIDIARGLGIIAVVLGHAEAGGITRYIFWFHMPLFFALSGCLFKPCRDGKGFKQLVRKDTISLLLPYLSFLLLVAAGQYTWLWLNGSAHSVNLSTYIFNLLVGGRFLKGWHATFWFITCLYVSRIAFAFITMRFSTRASLAVVGLAYLSAHLYTYAGVWQRLYIPGNIDVALIASGYYAFGCYARSLLENKDNRVLLLSLFLTVSFIVMQKLGVINYSLDLKYLVCNNLLLDLAIPLTITICICQLSHWLGLSPAAQPLTELGQRSLAIMYLHIPLNKSLQGWLGYGYAWFTVLGVAVPFLISRCLLERFSITRRLFLGKRESRQPVYHSWQV